jgi:homoserine acetyltransferase
MTWRQTVHESAFTAEDFLFADGARLDLSLAYRTIGELAPDKGNAVLLLHGTVGSAQPVPSARLRRRHVRCGRTELG